MKKNSILALMALLMPGFLGVFRVMAQDDWSQNTACPGWNNPASFTFGNTADFYWSGRNGTKTDYSGYNPPPPSNANNYYFSWGNNPVLSANQLATATSGSSSCDNTGIPSNDKQFVIMTNLNGHDPNTGNLLPYIPWQEFNTYDTTGAIVNTNLTKSIRIGDDCVLAKAAALYYNLKVKPSNAMLYIYYAIVVQAPGHGIDSDPTFVIRVTKQNSATQQWEEINDSLVYAVSSTPTTQTGGTVADGVNGWHKYSPSGYSYDDIFWKEWAKVSVNLSDYLYENLRIEVLMGDCSASGHWGYAYIAGECREMRIGQSGCPAGMDTIVTTLKAPRNMLNYVWSACEYGQTQNGMESDPMYTWRQLTPDEGAELYDYDVQADDFRITRRFGPNGTSVAVDSVSNMQTFRCKLTSALDPAKPFDSYLYANVTNTKPSMAVDSLLTCEGGVKVMNESEVPGDPSLVVRSNTQWGFYDNPVCEGVPVFTATGDSVQTSFTDTAMRWLRVRTETTDATCYSEAIYPIHPRLNPDAGMTISERVLCDADETTLVDITEGDNNRRTWYFLPANAPEGDMTLSDSLPGVGTYNRVVTRSFSHGVEPIELRVYNGSYCLDEHDDTVWCNTLVRDTVSVFLHPELVVTGDTVVCDGHKTNATVSAVGVDSCTYEWSTTYGQVTGGLPSGPTLQVVPYAEKATYYVKVTSPQNCVAWDSIHAYLVRPKLSIVPEDGKICPGDVATLTGTNAHHFTWTASPADPTLEGQDSASQIVVSPSQTTVYTMVGHGSNNCDATPLQKTVTLVPLAVSQVKLSPEYVDVDDPVVVMRDVSENSVASSWLFNDGSVKTGKEVSHTFLNCIGDETVNVTLTSYNELGCPQEYPFTIPVSVFTSWFPNIFTPGSSDGNSRFSFFTINDYQNFHIYIYNRRGELVFDSDDVNFSWDGTCNGEPCPQGAYVYTCRFLKPGTTALRTIQGSVTLVR